MIAFSSDVGVYVRDTDSISSPVSRLPWQNLTCERVISIKDHEPLEEFVFALSHVRFSIVQQPIKELGCTKIPPLPLCERMIFGNATEVYY